MGLRLRKILVIIISGVLAYLTGFYLIPRDVESSKETTMVLRFKKDIFENQLIKDEYIETVEIGSYNFPKNIYTDKEDVIGQYAKKDILAGEFAHENLIQNEIIPGDYFRYEDTRFDGISFIVDLAKCVGGMPKIGDRVRVIIYKQGKDMNTESEIVMHRELSAMEVIDIVNKEGESLNNYRSDTSTVSDNSIPCYITLKADVQQQEYLVKGIYEGEIHLALRPKVFEEENHSTTDEHMKNSFVSKGGNEDGDINYYISGSVDEESQMDNGDQGGFDIDD